MLQLQTSSLRGNSLFFVQEKYHKKIKRTNLLQYSIAQQRMTFVNLRFQLAIFFVVQILLPTLGLAKSSFHIMTQSEGDYIGGGKSWNFSEDNSCKIHPKQNSLTIVELSVQCIDILWMDFGFSSENGKSLKPGLYSPAKRLPFRGSFNGIDVGGDGRGCNTILGAFYVHQYKYLNGILEAAAIDFVQICEPSSANLEDNQRPKLYGSIRYKSNVSISCNSEGCAKVVSLFSKPSSDKNEKKYVKIVAAIKKGVQAFSNEVTP